jgi:WD40 repeat protein
LVFAALDADGLLAATWTRSSTNVQIWDVARSNVVHEVPAHLSIHVAFSPNNKWLIVGDSVEFRAWNIHTWQSLYAVPRDYTEYYGYMAFSADSGILAVAISRSTVRLVEAATGRELATLEAPERMDIHWITFNPDGTQLAVASGSGPIQLWDLRLIRQQLASMNLDWGMPPYLEGSREQAAK